MGYQFACERVDNEYEVVVGWPLTYPNGAHCRHNGMNWKAIGICFVGNYRKVTPEREMLKVAARRIIVPLMRLFSIPTANIKGHRDFAAKSCPGTLFDLEVLKTILAGQL